MTAMEELFYVAYQMFGASGVHDLASCFQTPYAECRACDAQMPFADGACLCCGEARS
jgi:hypothetical protein